MDCVKPVRSRNPVHDPDQLRMEKAPVILFINIMLYHNWFMDGWPGKRIKNQ